MQFVGPLFKPVRTVVRKRETDTLFGSSENKRVRDVCDDQSSVYWGELTTWFICCYDIEQSFCERKQNQNSAIVPLFALHAIFFCIMRLVKVIVSNCHSAIECSCLAAKLHQARFNANNRFILISCLSKKKTAFKNGVERTSCSLHCEVGSTFQKNMWV